MDLNNKLDKNMNTFQYTAHQNKIAYVPTRRVMAQSSIIIIFAFIFASDIFGVQIQTALAEINPSNIILQVYAANQNTTFKASTSASAEIQSVNIMQPVIFIIHGFHASSNSTWVQNMANLLIKKQPCNVITVDWSAYSSFVDYAIVTTNVGPVGNLVGDFIVNITINNSESLTNVHLIGHSLGAHIAGYAGQNVYAKMKVKVARISGLDAAGPLFYLKPDDQKLSKDDAYRVEATHTNGGRFGYRNSYGTSDFFPNGGGPIQPGCITDSCSHSRAHDLYIESIISDRFIAVQCSSNTLYRKGFCNSNNKTIMGNNEPSTASGNYYLSTNAKSPYAKRDSFP